MYKRQFRKCTARLLRISAAVNNHVVGPLIKSNGPCCWKGLATADPFRSPANWKGKWKGNWKWHTSYVIEEYELHEIGYFESPTT
jgi:hypothetical protein